MNQGQDCLWAEMDTNGPTPRLQSEQWIEKYCIVRYVQNAQIGHQLATQEAEDPAFQQEHKVTSRQPLHSIDKQQ